MENKDTFYKDYSNMMLEANALEKSEENPFFKSKYVPLNTVLSEAKKLCLANKFIFIQYLKSTENGQTLVTVLNTKTEKK